MAPTLATNALTAKETKAQQTQRDIKAIVDSLNKEWSLDLELPPPNQSPSSRPKTTEISCVAMITFICYKNTSDAFDVKNKFLFKADEFYDRWVKKPKADRGVVPVKTRGRIHPVSPEEKQTLLGCLRDLLHDISEKHKKAQTPGGRVHKKHVVDDSPIPLALSNRSESTAGYPELRKSSGDSKRSGDEFENLQPAKKARPSLSHASSSDATAMPPPEPGRGRPLTREPNPTRSADTSFASVAESVFTQASFTRNNTQETIPDEEPVLPRSKAFTERQPDKIESSDYASSSFEARVADISEGEVIISNIEHGVDAPASPVAEELSQNLNEFDFADETFGPMEQQLREMLDNVFPSLPSCLVNAPLPVLYEITRVYLHFDLGVLLTKVNVMVTDRLLEYDVLWDWMNSLPDLRGLTFPEKCSSEVWKAALDGYQRGVHCVTMVGKMTFNTKSSLENSDPLFRAQLNTMKIDNSHRIERRWGSDRVLEFQIPDFKAGTIPVAVKRLQKSVGDDRCKQLILDWLVDTPHRIFNRSWSPFSSKPLERVKKRDAKKDVRVDAYRITFFATDGPNFKRIRNPGSASKADRPVMTIDQFLDSLRPTKENEYQTYLKLFNRTVLALSRNEATLVLEESQILRRQNDIREGDIKPGGINYNAPRNPHPRGPVMNDGAGRISRTLAAKVKDKLALSYTPGAYQGRFGGAKGLWLVDHTDNSNTDWIEIYPSQQKWDRRTDGEPDDPSQRTLEINGISGPLKSADLNSQLLPLLVNGARDKNAMKHAISRILEVGLQQKLDELQTAIDSPECFKKFIRESNANSKEKLKADGVPCMAGLPVSREDRLNLLLEAGFLPKQLAFMKSQATRLFENRTDDLRDRMNITVGKSCFPYMVPDFWGVLEADEVYLDFSNFRDDTSGFSGVVLRDDYVLVARSPAHFPSDIQKVKAVVKPEFLGLKDVIIFPIKGNPSLADKLSGGDYDGDRAWVCWEEDIVNNFENSDVQNIESMVKQGYLTKDARMYKDLVKGSRDPTSTFLKASLDFNMRPSMLGIITNFKESVFYHSKDASHPANMALCQLCSDMVDQAKNGYGLTDASWTRFKSEKVGFAVRKPAYLSDALEDCRKSDHVLDHLKIIADKAIKKATEELHRNIGNPPSWDDDLVADYNWAYERRASSPGWQVMLDTLKTDLTSLKDAWSKFPWHTSEKEEATALKCKLYERFKAIRPPDDNVEGQILLGPNTSNDLSQWNLLKASTLFALYGRRYVADLVWWVSAKQLCHIKASKSETPHSVIPHMYILLKPDNTMIKKMQESFSSRNLEDMASVVNVEELDDFDDD